MVQDNGQKEKNGIIVAKHFMAELKILQLVARNLLSWVGTTLLHQLLHSCCNGVATTIIQFFQRLQFMGKRQQQHAWKKAIKMQTEKKTIILRQFKTNFPNSFLQIIVTIYKFRLHLTNCFSKLRRKKNIEIIGSSNSFQIIKSLLNYAFSSRKAKNNSIMKRNLSH